MSRKRTRPKFELRPRREPREGGRMPRVLPDNPTPRDRACTGKRYHATRAGADAQARGHILETGELVHPYHCRFCNYWHVGHQNP